MENGHRRLKTLILAAGKGTRMGSDLAKVLHRIHGRPLLDYVVEVAEAAGSEEIVVIVGHQADLVREIFAGRNLAFVEQREQLGTGHAVLQAREAFAGYDGDVLILCGGLGPTANVLVRNGTLRIGDAVLCGEHYGKIKAMIDIG